MSNVDAVLALFRSIGDQDLDAVGEHFADDAEWEEVPIGLTYRGPAGWRKNVEYWQDGFTDGKAEVVCDFCKKIYDIDKEQLIKLRDLTVQAALSHKDPHDHDDN